MSRRFRDRKPRDNFEEVADMARSAYRIGREIKDMINVECKQLVGSSEGLAAAYVQPSWVGSTPVILNAIGLAVTDNSRISDSVKLQNLTVRWHHNLSTAFAGQSYQVRFVVWWQEDNTLPLTLFNATPPAFAIFNSFSGGNGTAPMALKDWDNRFVTKILYDKTYQVTGSDITALGTTTPIKEKILKIDKHTQFDNGSTTIITGGLYMAWITNHAANVGHVVSFTTGLSFTDD